MYSMLTSLSKSDGPVTVSIKQSFYFTFSLARCHLFKSAYRLRIQNITDL